MKEPSILYLALLFWLSALTKAAPPLNSQPSALLSLLNATTSFSPLHNISIDPPFTPGREPSEDIIFYDVPFSNPPVNLKFKYYDYEPERNETDVEKCFQQAVMECGDREKHFMEMEEGQSWTSGRSLLGILPKKEGPDAGQFLTYGIFTDALQGLNNFRLFYPHLYFQYEVFVYPGEEQYETYVGEGELGIF